MENVRDISISYHKEGYNCCQCIIKTLATKDEADYLTMIASSFNGGVGAQRQICGVVSGLAILAGVRHGFSTPEKGELKAKHTAFVSMLCDEFKNVTGTIVCGELLKKEGFDHTKNPNNLTCDELIALGAEIGSKYFK